MPEISKTYEPQSIEEKWYAEWLAQGCFTADPTSSKPAYSIAIPPPNVTGVLTLGHVLNNTIQDILARRARMLGKEVLWLPGTDHAGIATQNVVEKSLRKSGEIKHRDDLGRDKLVEKIWEWKEEYGGKILKQLRALGASCDWTRTRFTMDEDYSRCVQSVFVDLYKKGLIYRGKRMVNWCPVALTALSDEEVIMKPTNGFLTYFKVEVADQPGTFLTIATTRPETIPGDTAIAVNPIDPRYAHLIGKFARRPLPLENQALIPIVAEESIDIAFGTGVLKVTPAHDKTDFEIGQRHQLETIEVINPRGVMNDLAGKDLAGLERFEARKKSVELLRELGLLEREEPYQNNVGYSERADVPIEPRLSEQWFLKYPSVENSRAVVADGEMQFHPDRWAKVYEHWMGNLQDWCISRQLWWGHRIPVWYRVKQASSLFPLEDHKLEACATFQGHDEYAEIDISRRNLPHWAEKGATYFVTFRLADSLPAEKLAVLEEERDIWLELHPTPWNEDEKSEYFHRFSETIDEWLDQGAGSCVLANPKLGKIVADAFRHFDKQRYDLGAWVVMPNHVHALVTPREDHTLSSILHSWKSFTSTKLNDALNRTGQLWQHESYDHIVRNEKALLAITRYIDNNPTKAGIKVEQASSLFPPNDHKLEACATLYVGLEPPIDPENWAQDPDVLDTWFSSWLWPFATMGWPGKTPELAKFYPTTDLVTGPDIIFFWVARMIMAGYEWMGEMPFKNVYFTGIIRDKQGRKMSKSLGNSPDPLDLIAKFGADALRFGVMRSAPLGQDVLFDEKNVELGRNFCTKLWNAARFRQMHEGVAEAEINPALLTSDDHWLLVRLDLAIREVSAALDNYLFSDAAQILYRFFWSEYCDWYLEAAKAALYGSDAGIKKNTLSVMDFVFGHALRLFHPFLPFITEELWQTMGFQLDLPDDQGGKTIMFAHWPAPLDDDFKTHYGLTPEATLAATNKYDTVLAGRTLRAGSNIVGNKRVRFVLQPTDPLTLHDAEVLKILLNADPLDLENNYAAPKGTPSVSTPLGQLFLPLEGLVNFDAERERLQKELAKVQDELTKVRAKLANPGFTEKVPAAVLEDHRNREKIWQEKLTQLEAMLAALG